jgi:hypothetical protein
MDATDGPMGTETRMATRRSGAWAGWIAFAGTMLAVIGMINIFQGLVALLADERVFVTRDRFILVDVTSWGWTLVLSGVVLLGVGGALVAGLRWARYAAIVVGLHAAAQVAWLGAYPIWSLLMIALDTVVLYALTARWSEAREGLRSYDSGAGDGMPAASYGRLPHETAAFQRHVY